MVVLFAASVWTPMIASAQAIPSAEVLNRVIQEAYAKYKDVKDGATADYIPELAKVPSELFGLAIVTARGDVYTAGDVNYSFSIQSVSKPFTAALVMQEQGNANAIAEKIGVEPTGLPFNSILATQILKPVSVNPLVNSGAIASVSMVKAKDAQERFAKIMAFFQALAGEKLTVLEDVYKSEAATNQRNRAHAYILAASERIYSDPMEAVDVYTRQCSIGVTAKQLAMMGATLANFGANPITGEQVIKRENVPEILATMTMAGLYDGSGGWAWHVGLPAKSGVGGGLVAVVPGKGAIAVFAPPLDKAGNSVKAQRVISYVADKLGINLYSPRSVGLK